MTTLADLPKEQRKQYLGMWADFRVAPVVITRVYWHRNVPGWFVDVFDPTEGWEETNIPILCIEPRHDLPRAWNPDGTPVKGR